MMKKSSNKHGKHWFSMIPPWFRIFDLPEKQQQPSPPGASSSELVYFSPTGMI
jgi:hypothetical protein